MIMEWLRRAPTSLVIALFTVVGVATVAYLFGYVYLTANGADTTEYRGLLNTAFNYVGILLGATTTVASVAAAKSSGRTEEQTNGNLAALQQEVNRLSVILAGRPAEQQDTP